MFGMECDSLLEMIFMKLVGSSNYIFYSNLSHPGDQWNLIVGTYGFTNCGLF